jgi:hypothetical protein
MLQVTQGLNKKTPLNQQRMIITSLNYDQHFAKGGLINASEVAELPNALETSLTISLNGLSS